MSTLWKRASPREIRVLRIIAGAVLNANDAHPGAAVDKKFARSVAKRAVGTLSSQWGDTLAAPDQRPSLSERDRIAITLRRRAYLRKLCKRGPAKATSRWPPLAFSISKIAKEIGAARRAGQIERAQGMIECLRIIDRMVKRELAA